jgi:hypothetical protein
MGVRGLSADVRNDDGILLVGGYYHIQTSLSRHLLLIPMERVCGTVVVTSPPDEGDRAVGRRIENAKPEVFFYDRQLA